MKEKIIGWLYWACAFMSIVLSFITTYHGDIDLTLLCLILAVVIGKDLTNKGE